jgi:protein-tyrosine-phosphatase
MSWYRPSTGGESTLTAEERRAEADRILAMFDAHAHVYEQMSERDSGLVDTVSDVAEPVSAKQLFWLRDVLSRYLDA